jgi:hypothetical protein
MFHQPNLGAYDGTHSLLGDLLDTTFAKYTRLVTVPISSPTEEQLGQRMAARMAYNASGVTAQMIGQGTLVIAAKNAATIPISGLVTACSQCTEEPYAGQTITWVKLNAGQSVTLTAQNPLPSPVPRVSVANILPNSGPTSGKSTVAITGGNFQSGFTGPFDPSGVTVTFDTTPGTILSVSFNAILVTTPAHAAGTVPVTVTVGGQSVTTPNAFTYRAGGKNDAPDDPTVVPTPNPAPAPRPAPGTTGTAPDGSGAPAAPPAPAPTAR